MTTPPDVRLPAPDPTVACLCASLEAGLRSMGPEAGLRTISPEQLDQAVLQLRERRDRPAGEQMLAVLRALELTVAPRIEHPC